jgi:hypothetical protein
MGTVYCFSGPTIPPDQVRDGYPGIVALPPVQHGDLFRLDAHVGDTVVILDGFLMQHPPLRHKEILDLVDTGTTVVGGASMGALRAAELHRHGMLGIGKVFRFFRSGCLNADDEVTIAHLDEEHQYRPVSEALVNLRLTVSSMVRREMLQRVDAQLVVKTARRMAFYDRHLSHILERSVCAGMSSQVASDFVVNYRACFQDVKRADAEQILTTFQASSEQGSESEFRPPTRSDDRPQSVYVYLWRQEEVRDVRIGGTRIGSGQVLACAQGLAEDYEAFHGRITRRLAFATIGGLSHRRGRDSRDFREAITGLTRGLNAAELSALHLRPDEVTALCRYREAATRAGSEDPSWEEILADRVRQLGWFSNAGNIATIDTPTWLTPAECESLTPSQRVARQTLRSFAWWPGVIPWHIYTAELKLTEGFAAAAATVAASEAFNIQLRADDARHTLSHVSNRKLASWFIERWHASDAPHARLCDRGFPNTQVLLERLSPVFPFAYVTEPRLSVGAQLYEGEN